MTKKRDMHPGTDPHTQTWWRFSRYELRDGYIRPAPDAKLEEYAPWDQHRSGRDARMRKEQPPYQELVDVLREYRLVLGSVSYCVQKLLRKESGHGKRLIVKVDLLTKE